MTTTETKEQLELLTIEKYNTVIEKTEETKQEVKIDVICICGDKMNKIESIHCIICDSSDHDVTYQCNGNKHINVMEDMDGWLICMDCRENIKDFTWNDLPNIHKPQELYFIFNNNTVNGPYLKDEIITLYIKNTFKKNKIWIKSAKCDHIHDDTWDGDKWNELHFPHKINESKDITKYIEMNKSIKEKFPDLYESLFINILLGRIEKVNVLLPKRLPNQFKQSYFSLFTQKLGKIIFYVMESILGIHCIGTLLIAVVTSCFIRKGVVIYPVVFLGIAVVPILIVYFVLLNYWSELQSWMISYIIWGIISFLLSFATLIRYSLRISSGALDTLVFLIIGVDLGDLNVNFVGDDFGLLSIMLHFTGGGNNEMGMCSYLMQRDSFGGIGRFYVFPSLACALPAAACGFIANYFLEEKFQLKCDDLCFNDSGIECCEVISSHDIENSYDFVGGLASNILAVWAIIRVIGYLIVNASPSLSIYAKRAK